MTLSTSDARSGPYSTAGGNTIYDYDFLVRDAGHLTVIRASADGAETLLSHPADFTATGIGEADGGQITLTATPAADNTIIILRQTPVQQETDYGPQSALIPNTIEAALDQLTMVQQDHAERLNRAVSVAATSSDNPANYKRDIDIAAAATAAHAGNAVTAAATATAAETTTITKAGEAAASASAANTDRIAAETARQAADTALDDFTDIYLGDKVSNPATDNDGDALVTGALYFNTADKEMRAYNAGDSTWYSVTDAAQSASAAAASASAAANSESNAGSSESSANTSAGAANQSASDAAQSASDAAASESKASSSETNAATSETNAATSETNAAASAQTATTKAADAAASADAAAGLEVLGRAKFAAQHLTIQSPLKVIDFTTGFGESEISFTRPTVNHYTSEHRMVASAGTNTPIFQHSPTGAPEGLYISPARTRLNLHPTEFENIKWSKSGAAVTANDGPSPDGGNNAGKLEDTATSSLGAVYQNTLVGASTAPYIFSIYVTKRPGAPVVRILAMTNNPVNGPQANAYVDPESGATSGDGIVGKDYGVEDVGRFWRLWCIVRNDGSGPQSVYTFIYPAARAPGDISGFNNNSVTGYNHFWGAILEKSDVLAPVILGAEGSQVTVDGDGAEIDLATAPWFDGSTGEGTFLFDLKLDWAQQNAGVVQLRTVSGAYANWRNTAGGDYLGTAVGVRRGNDGDFRFSGTAWSGDHHRKVRTMGDHRAVIAWDQVGFTVGLDGDAPDSMAWNVPPEAFTELHIGNAGGQPTMAGRLARITYWPRKLSDAEIQTITGA